MSTALIFQQLGISLGLGLLVGLQRERSEADAPGLRTFPLITILGTVCALIGRDLGGWVVFAGFVGLIVILLFPVLIRMRQADADPGITTDVAALLMYAVGALVVVLPEQPGVPVAIGGGVAVLLQYKLELHTLARQLGDRDIKAIMQFVLLSCVILPVLPNQNFFLGVVNPRETWLMVVLIVGMSLGGYILYKFLGRDAGILLGGLLGGAISSTATTVSQARQTSDGHADIRPPALIILIASTVVFVRVLIEAAVVAPAFLKSLAPPIAVIMLIMLIPVAVVWLRVRKQPSEMPAQGNPTELKTALMFGAMYTLVLLALAWVKEYVGDRWLFGVAILSGLTDMDAITLSTARMFRTESAQTWIATDGWRLVVSAALANMIFKSLMVASLAPWKLTRYVILLFALPFAGGLAVLFLWP